MRYCVSEKPEIKVYKVLDDEVVWESHPLKDLEQASELIDALKFEDRLGIQ